MRIKKYKIPFFVLALFIPIVLLNSCGKVKTEKLLMNKRWAVYNVTPPSGTFNIAKSERAKKLKNGFYKNAWFEFLQDSMFVTCFRGKVDTGKYVIRGSGDAVALYPRHGHKIYEQIKILKLTDSTLNFKTQVAKFNMILHLRAEPAN